MSFKKRKARRRLGCDHCKKAIEVGQYYVQIERTDEYGRDRIRYHNDCSHAAKSTNLARAAFGEAA